MQDFKDIVRRNRPGVVRVIESFGYNVVDDSDLNRSINELIAAKGEPALREIMNIHPDKKVIIELFGEVPVKEGGCGCGGKCKDTAQNYHNASGTEMVLRDNQNQSQTQIAHQTNVVLILSTVLIAVALIINKK